MTRDGDPTASRVVKRSMVVAGHATSISLEDAFWSGLKTIADERGFSVAGLVAEIDGARRGANLSSAVRVFVLLSLAGAQEGHSPVRFNAPRED